MIRLMRGVTLQTTVSSEDLLYNSGLVDIRNKFKRNRQRRLVMSSEEDLVRHMEKSDILRHLSGVHQVDQKRHGLRMWRKVWGRRQL